MGRKTNLETSSFSDTGDTFLVLPEMLNDKKKSSINSSVISVLKYLFVCLFRFNVIKIKL